MTDKKNTTTPEADDNKARSAARSAALSALRKNHAEEYNDLLAKEMEERGIDWSPRLTPEQKAKAEIARLSETFNIDLAEIANVNAGDVAYTDPTDG